MDQTPRLGVTQHFAGLTDPRVERTKEHALLDIITIALCAVICGADTWVDVERFGKAKEAWLRTFLPLPNGIPCHDTFGRVFACLDPEEFERAFVSWVQTLVGEAGEVAGQVVAIDGKTLRRSHDRSKGKGALHLVSAWATTHRLVLGQVAVDRKSNEITAIPALLRVLAVQGCTVTIDAMGCQTAIAKQIVEQDADYVLALKENQPSVYQAVADTFTLARATAFADLKAEPYGYQRTVDRDHGRLEIRQYWTIRDPEVVAYVNPTGAWTRLRSLGMVEAERRIGDQVSVETRYYLSSLAGEVTAFSAAVRGHWGIENRLHWVLDIAFREDESRVRVGDGAQNLALLRRIALNLLRREPTARVGIKARRLMAGWDDAYLLKVLHQ